MKLKAFRERKNELFLSKLTHWQEKLTQKSGKRIVLGVVVIGCLVIANIFSSVLTNLFDRFPNQLAPVNWLSFHLIRYPWIYGLTALGGVGIYYYLLFRIQLSYGSLEEGNKATGRFTTLEELIAQYKAVPIKGETPEETYPGLSGTIVARYKDKVYIDTDPAHNYILGRSRSAKGQTKVLPDMDVYSRSEEKPHLIYASGKYELAAAGMGKETLQRRGYECSVLNLIDLDRSFQYNPLDLVKQAYLKGDIDEAIELCKTFSYPLYHNDEAREPVWEETAMALVNAVILALCYEFIERSEKPELTEKYVSLYAVANMLVELGTPDEKNGKTLLDRYFAQLPAGNPAKMEYSTVQYADGQMKASIFATTQAKLRQFIAPKVAKLMAQSTFDFRKLTKDDSPIDMTENIVIRGYVDTQTEGEYTLTYEITNDFDEKVQVERMITVGKGLIYQTLPNKDPYFSGVEHIEMPPGAKFDPREGVSCIYRYKPQAVFLVLPDYIQTNYIIASTWISQMYHVASDFAADLPGGELKKRIRCGLDEFGNLPGFSNISSMLSVGAGRGILIDFYVQHPNQLTNKYNEKVGEFIADESMNKYFLLSGSRRAREDFSALLGEQEVTIKSRSGGVLDLNKQYTESLETRPLISPDELGRLEEGEVVVERSIHRQDLKGNPVRPYPIFNTGEDQKLLYAFRYLEDQFDPNINWRHLSLPTVPNLELETYSKTFAQRIKEPFKERENEEQIKRLEGVLKEMEEAPESVLDQYDTVSDQQLLQKNLEGIEVIQLPEERKKVIEVLGQETFIQLTDFLQTEEPRYRDFLDDNEYYDMYLSFLQQPENKPFYQRLKGLGFVPEENKKQG